MGQKLKVDLTNTPIGTNIQFKQYIDNFRNHFNVLGGGAVYFDEFVFEKVKLASPIVTDITLSSIINTYVNSLTDGGKHDNSFVRGIRFYPGLKLDTSVVPNVWRIKWIVVPTCLNSVKVNGWPTADFTFTPGDVLSAAVEMYTVEGGLLLPIPYANAQDLIHDYNLYIRIWEDDTNPPTFREYRPADDVACVFFPFEEIEQVYIDNIPVAGNFLYLVSVGIFDTEHTPHIYKHTLAIAAQEPTVAKLLAGIFAGKAADLANLCPPHCANTAISLNTTPTGGAIGSIIK